MWLDFIDYINNQTNNKPTQILEVGVGNFFKIADTLNKYPNINVLLMDIKPNREDVIKDDINNPNKELYTDVSIIYSIRPPYEIQKQLSDLARDIGALLIIKPYLSEELASGLNMKLVNYKKAIFFIKQY